ncbi:MULTISPECIES: hypothetical protein [Actinomycetota]|uniref:hypothetical protein n=1 Tax=Actinomycetota TaxID=201174 RepID=UPI0021535E62|nr:MULTISPECIES: hypothetical protein [Actinomycetota]
MADKFLGKEGLLRLIEKLKEKFATLDSPAFTGKPTVQTPTYIPDTRGKEIVNREYVDFVTKLLIHQEMPKLPKQFKWVITPDSWQEVLDGYVYGFFYEKYYKPHKERYSNNAQEQNVALDIKIDFERLPSMRFYGMGDIKEVCKLTMAIGSDWRIYCYGDKPSNEIPVIITFMQVEDVTDLIKEAVE